MDQSISRPANDDDINKEVGVSGGLSRLLRPKDRSIKNIWSECDKTERMCGLFVIGSWQLLEYPWGQVLPPLKVLKPQRAHPGPFQV